MCEGSRPDRARTLATLGRGEGKGRKEPASQETKLGGGGDGLSLVLPDWLPVTSPVAGHDTACEKEREKQHRQRGREGRALV